jgi:hypothetical protein
MQPKVTLTGAYKLRNIFFLTLLLGFGGVVPATAQDEEHSDEHADEITIEDPAAQPPGDSHSPTEGNASGDSASSEDPVAPWESAEPETPPQVSPPVSGVSPPVGEVSPNPAPSVAPKVAKQEELKKAEEVFGIRVISLRRTGAGTMLDLRYRIVDAAKAKVLLERKLAPVLRDHRTGIVAGVPRAPKVGQLRSTGKFVHVNDRNYTVIFANPGRLITRGSRVSLMMGELSASDLIVE